MTDHEEVEVGPDDIIIDDKPVTRVIDLGPVHLEEPLVDALVNYKNDNLWAPLRVELMNGFKDLRSLDVHYGLVLAGADPISVYNDAPWLVPIVSLKELFERVNEQRGQNV